MVLYALFVGISVLAIVDLIGAGVLGYLFYQEIMPIIKAKRMEPSLVKRKEEEWKQKIELASKEIVEKYPDSKGVKRVIELVKQKTLEE